MTALLTPGTRYPALLAALSFPGLQRLPASIGPQPSQRDMASILVAMGTSPSCQWNLTAGPLATGSLPPILSGLLDELEEQREKNRAIAHLLRWEDGVREGCMLLARAGLPHPIVLKGGAAKYTLYPLPHLRTSADLDLLLPREQVPEAVELMERGGFQLVVTDVRRPYTARHGHQVMLRRGHTIVELHRSIDNLARPSLSYERLLLDSVPLPDLHPWLRGPSPVDSLLIAAAHALKHGLLVSLRDLVDIQLALESSTLDEPLLHRRVREAALEQALAFLALQAGSLSGRWTARHSSLAMALPWTGALFGEWRYGGNSLGDGFLRKLLAHLFLTPGTASTQRLLTRFIHRRGMDLMARGRGGAPLSR